MNYLFLDAETGGLTPDHSLLEVGAILTDCELAPLATYRALIRHPHYVVTARALAVNGLSIAQCETDGVSLTEAGNALLALGPAVPAGWNVAFDVAFVRAWLPAATVGWPYQLLDVQSAYLLRFGVLGSLRTAARQANVINPAPHRALGDCETTLGVARWLRGLLPPEAPL